MRRLEVGSSTTAGFGGAPADADITDISMKHRENAGIFCVWKWKISQNPCLKIGGMMVNQQVWWVAYSETDQFGGFVLTRTCRQNWTENGDSGTKDGDVFGSNQRWSHPNGGTSRTWIWPPKGTYIYIIKKILCIYINTIITIFY